MSKEGNAGDLSAFLWRSAAFAAAQGDGFDSALQVS